MVVQELAAIIGIQTEQNKGQSTADGFQRGEHIVLALAGHAHALGPAAGHVGGDQREQVLAAIADAAMGHQVDLQEADALLVPGRPGADWYLRLEERTRLGGSETADELKPERVQPAIDCGSAHGQELAPHQRLQTQRTLGLQCRDQFVEEGGQALATQPAAGLSAQTQRANHDGRIDASPTTMPCAWRGRAVPKQPDRVLAVITRGGTELVE
jgi:hypothetical protein